MSDSDTPKKAESSTAALFSAAKADGTPAAAPPQKTTPPAGGSPFGVLFQAPDLTEVPKRKRAAAKLVKDSSDGQSKGQQTRDESNSGADSNRSDDSGNSNSGSKGSGKSGGKGKKKQSAPSSDSAENGSTDPEAQPKAQADTSADSSPDDADNRSDDSDGNDADNSSSGNGRRRRRGGKGRRNRGGGDGEDTERSQDSAGKDSDGQSGGREQAEKSNDDASQDDDGDGSSKRRRRRTRGAGTERGQSSSRDEATGIKGSTRLEAKRQRRKEGREAGRRRTIITEAEFLARRESVDRVMVVRGREDRTQIGVLEDGVLVEHYVSRETQSTMVGNVYLGRVQNVLPSMEAAFIDIGKGRNAVLYAGEVNWDTAGMEGNQPRRIENALSSGDSVLVQVTKDPIGHKGARLTSQVSLPGRYLVYVPGNSMTGISRKLPDTERSRLKKILKEVVPADAGVIVRTAAEGASEAELRADVERLTGIWERIEKKSATKSANAPVLLHGEPDMTVRVIRDVFNEDFSKLVVSGAQAWDEVSDYIGSVAPDLADRVEQWTKTEDIFTAHRVSESLSKAMDRKVWLPSGGSLVIDRTEAMTVVDVNTGKFVGSGGNLEETVTKNNIEAAEEIVRQLRLRDIGGIIVIDFIDMVLESNRELVVRRLLECLGRDRTKHQVAEVTSLGLVQMTRKRVGAGLIEVFSEPCVHCAGRGLVVHTEPIDRPSDSNGGNGGNGQNNNRSRSKKARQTPVETEQPTPTGPTAAQIAAAAHAAALTAGSSDEAANATAEAVVAEVAPEAAKTEDSAPRQQADQAEKPEAKGSDVVALAEPVAEAKPASESKPAAKKRRVAKSATTTAPKSHAPAVQTQDSSVKPNEQGSTHLVADPVQPAVALSAPAPRKRGSRRAKAPQAAASSTSEGMSAEPVKTAPVTSVAGSATLTATSADTSTATNGSVQGGEATKPVKRRSRGRVVAPAGPPVGGSDEA
ncbi:Rne/Rng family ribonuclease [Ornithinimicrobium sp. Arc0846-15]|nr:Rne/Rng family ribonuclease [Ornithinimicrobium laminariae]